MAKPILDPKTPDSREDTTGHPRPIFNARFCFTSGPHVFQRKCSNKFFQDNYFFASTVPRLRVDLKWREPYRSNAPRAHHFSRRFRRDLSGTTSILRETKVSMQRIDDKDGKSNRRGPARGKIYPHNMPGNFRQRDWLAWRIVLRTYVTLRVGPQFSLRISEQISPESVLTLGW